MLYLVGLAIISNACALTCAFWLGGALASKRVLFQGRSYSQESERGMYWQVVAAYALAGVALLVFQYALLIRWALLT